MKQLEFNKHITVETIHNFMKAKNRGLGVRIMRLL
jgi:hypothetical protein